MHFKLVNFKSYNFLDMFLDIARNARYARNARKKFSSRFYISPWAWSVGLGEGNLLGSDPLSKRVLY